MRGAAHVVLLARTVRALEDAVVKINEQLNRKVASFYAVDVSNSSDAKDVTSRIRESIGVPDVIVCSSAAGEFESIEESTPLSLSLALQCTVQGPFNVIHSFVRELIERQSGQIVFIGSPARAIRWWPVVYSCSRHALFGLAESLREDLREHNIKVTYYEPSRIYPGGYLSELERESRMPLFYRDQRFSFLFQSCEEVGECVCKAVENGKEIESHWFVWLSIIFTSIFGFWLLRLMRRFDVDHELGGPLVGAKRRDRNQAILLAARSKQKRS
eukprot:TRINITY_DN7044_c0_g1_i1.p1 TRINITY_DN7044_c0_g1~~TRINITY_DN7044_c0_g1_i1.p1  ORF type:complete len:297 (-),score=28.86 TRINITY_DN7044_c0_g1_i1:219-1034(-)